jgi:hypothetical protein
MKTIFFTLLLPALTLAAPQESNKCAKLFHLEEIVNLSNNATKLDKLPAAEQARVKALAANATAELSTLESNKTLVAICQQRQDCREYDMLERWNNILNNATKVSQLEGQMLIHGRNHTHGQNVTAEEIAQFKANVTAKLNTLSQNTTLVNECKGTVQGGGANGSATGTGK